MICIEVPLVPLPWAAPRRTKDGFYDIRDKYKKELRTLLKEAYKEKPLEGYVCLFMGLYFPVPKSASAPQKVKMLKGEILPTRADCTNCQKLVEDCAKNILFNDDRNVTVVSAFKAYAMVPGIVIQVYPLKEYWEQFEAAMKARV